MTKLNSMVSSQEGKYTERRFILPAFGVLADHSAAIFRFTNKIKVF